MDASLPLGFNNYDGLLFQRDDGDADIQCRGARVNGNAPDRQGLIAI
jgi:hypothetical protein